MLDWWLEGRGRFASWAGLYSFYALMIPAIGGIVVLRRRHIPISPLIALVVDRHARGDDDIRSHTLSRPRQNPRS